MDNRFEQELEIGSSCNLNEIVFSPKENHFKKEITKLYQDSMTESLSPNEYFSISTPYVSTLLVPPKNYTNIQAISKFFPRGLTDFLGFECRLNAHDSQTDWALAISGKGNARHVLADFLNNGHLPSSYKQIPEWKQIHNFSKMWINENSVLHKRILGAWLEFDMPENSPDIPVPSVFFNPSNINGKTANDITHFEWFTKHAVPALIGRKLTKSAEKNVHLSIMKMPSKASLFIVGIMLSRKTSDVRMSVLFKDSAQLMPYLRDIGYQDKTDVFADLVNELEKRKANRMVLDFDIGKRIGKKIAIECSFHPNKFHEETQWKTLLDFFVEKGYVTSEKRDELLRFPGKDEGTNIVRYITHLKIVYEPGKPLRVKAYLAIRHFLNSHITKMSA